MLKLEENPEDRLNDHSISASVDAVRSHLKATPRLGLILGSGWGSITQLLKNPVTLPLTEIPHFPCPKVSGHGAQLLLGQLAGQEMIILSGRKHLYEGEGLARVLYPVEVFRRLGIHALGLTNAAGATHPRLSVGDLMIIRDHIDSTWHRFTAPLARWNDNASDQTCKAPDCSSAGQAVYDREFIGRLTEIAQRERLPVYTGVYAFTLGPFYESSSEVRCLGAWGADAVGMSTVPEATYARRIGLRVFGLSGITNMGTGLTPEQHSHDSVKAQANLLAPRATTLLARFLESLNSSSA